MGNALRRAAPASGRRLPTSVPSATRAQPPPTHEPAASSASSIPPPEAPPAAAAAASPQAAANAFHDEAPPISEEDVTVRDNLMKLVDAIHVREMSDPVTEASQQLKQMHDRQLDIQERKRNSSGMGSIPTDIIKQAAEARENSSTFDVAAFAAQHKVDGDKLARILKFVARVHQPPQKSEEEIAAAEERNLTPLQLQYRRLAQNGKKGQQETHQELGDAEKK